jgi:hypothetical protein
MHDFLWDLILRSLDEEHEDSRRQDSGALEERHVRSLSRNDLFDALNGRTVIVVSLRTNCHGRSSRTQSAERLSVQNC